MFANSSSSWSLSLCICIKCVTRQSLNHDFLNSLPLLLKIGMTLHWKCRLGNVYPLLNSYYVSVLVQLLSHKDVVASEASNSRLVFKKCTNGVTLAMDFNDFIYLYIDESQSSRVASG